MTINLVYVSKPLVTVITAIGHSTELCVERRMTYSLKSRRFCVLLFFLFVLVYQTWPFHHPVSAKGVPDYHRIVKIPMDLQTMREVITTTAHKRD